MGALELHQTFSCWRDFFDAVSIYCEETSQAFIKASCKLCTQANKYVKKGRPEYPIEMEYTYYNYKCCNAGTVKSAGQGKRTRRYKERSQSQKLGCQARIYASLDSKDRTKIRVKILNDVHNHPTSPNLYEKYMKQRLLTAPEKAKLEELIRLKVPLKKVQQEFSTARKQVIKENIRNIRTGVRLKHKNAVKNMGDVQLLVHQLNEVKDKDPQLVSEFLVDKSNAIQYVFVQTSEMKETFNRFPEHVCIDRASGLNDKGMTIVSFLVVDGNSNSRPVAFAFVAKGCFTLLLKIFLLFKQHNPLCSSIKIFMVDNDLNEVAQLERLFPLAIFELCPFHVKKSFHKKVDNLQCQSSVKVDIQCMIEQLCFAKSAQEYEEIKGEMMNLYHSFSTYFLNKWDLMRERWVFYARCEHLNFDDSTNNRIEVYHQRVKSMITSPAPLDICLAKVLFLHECMLKETQHVNTEETPAHDFPNLQEYVTAHALGIAAKEVESSVDYSCSSLGTKSTFYVVVNKEGQENHKISGSVCTCYTSQSLLLPCRHIVAFRRAIGEEPLALSLFPKRWHKDYNKSIVSQTVDDKACVSDTSTDCLMSDSGMCVEDKKGQYELAKPQLDRLLNLLMELGDDRMHYYLDQLQVFEQKISENKQICITDEEADVMYVEEHDAELSEGRTVSEHKQFCITDEVADVMRMEEHDAELTDDNLDIVPS